eukprot:CAMPEP_0179457720 /NCGR_PEP_ID=MMETSP0799-20121207/41435_1 /TAXON_ID=46947 /ORGANISM="Geminigera cryophila, Strain CCMP2564" /LENGTH=203 /DNA_ID=CAMNT_0021258583 /DNA_START=436 /DNA_END=1043 /DNA_ORIENTATION=-
MPSETVATGPGPDEHEVERYWKKFWETNVVNQVKFQHKWAEFKDKPMAKVVISMKYILNQSELNGQRCQNEHEGMGAVDYSKNESVLLMRYVELASLLLGGEQNVDKHPDKLAGDAKRVVKKDLEAAMDRLDKSKERLKSRVKKMYKDQLRQNAVADTKTVGDALNGTHGSKQLGGANGNVTIMNAGDALLRESYAQLPGRGG